MKARLLGVASVAALLLSLSACHGANEPFASSNAVGSCQYTTTDGYDYCEDFLGTQYNQSIAQNICATSTVAGTWSPDACATAGAIGTCAIPIGGDTQNVQYTYTGSATTLTVETACGLAGGTFTAN